MSTAGPRSVREGGRRSHYVRIGGIFCGSAIACLGAFLYLVRTAPAASVLGFALRTDQLAVGTAVFGAAIVLASMFPAIRLARSTAGQRPLTFGSPKSTVATGTPFQRSVALAILEPAVDGAEISLLGAVLKARQEAGPTEAGAIAELIANDADDVVTMYATFFAEHIAIYGCRRPSADVERVFLTNPLKEFHVEAGELVLKDRRGGLVYDGLRIKAADYPLALQRLRSES